MNGHTTYPISDETGPIGPHLDRSMNAIGPAKTPSFRGISPHWPDWTDYLHTVCV